MAYTWIDFAKGWQKDLMKLIRYPGGYMRFLAATSLDCYKAGERVEHYEKTGALEQNFYQRKIHEDRWSTTWQPRALEEWCPRLESNQRHQVQETRGRHDQP